MSIGLLMAGLLVGLLLSLALRWHFKTFSSTLSNREDFASVFPFIVLTTVFIISVVKSSLALSLGLVGALSIVRFRTPVKEPEELAYLFVAIAMGLGLGAGQIETTLIASLVILGAVSAIHWTRRDREAKNLYLSVNWSDASESSILLDRLNSLCTSHTQKTDLRRFDVRDGSAEATYFIGIEDSARLSALVEEIQATFPGAGVTFIDQSNIPSV